MNQLGRVRDFTVTFGFTLLGMAGRLEILVTNDDGIHSEGIIGLAKALREIGEVFVVAPDREKTAVAHSLTLHRPLRVEKIKRNFWTVDGTPADCIYLGVNAILSHPPRLIVSGINKGGNMGDDVTYSGTVSAAFEGTLLGIPSFAISINARSHFKFRTAARFATRVARYIAKNGLPKDTFLNINVPNVDEREIKSYKITQQGRWTQNSNAVVEKMDPRGKKYYWVGGEFDKVGDHSETDLSALHRRKVSVTPLRLDLTDYTMMRELSNWMSDESDKGVEIA